MKMIFDLDMDKCVACGACAVACMDQNDLEPENGDELLRRVGMVNPLPGLSRGDIGFLSLGCMHCEDAPCIRACPVNCLYKNDMWLTVYDNTNCIGCHSCEMACPFACPTYMADGKMRKCDGCAVRLENGLLPACVRICPTGALTCRSAEEYEQDNPVHSLRDIIHHLEE